MKTLPSLLIAFLTLIFTATAVRAADDADPFPLRKSYPTLKTMEVEELDRRFADVVVVDVRSAYEYETLRIKGAKLVPIGPPEFDEQIKALRNENPSSPMAFYCNGHSCAKAYQAVQRASQDGLTNLFVFDPGVFDWATAHPERAELLGKTVEPGKLISEKKFAQHLLAPEAFMQKLMNTPNPIIIDIRDAFQREGLSLFNMREHFTPLDNQALKTYTERAKAENRALFVVDATGRQVQWLQYFLEDQRVPEYYFMKGGAKAYYDIMNKR